MHHQDQFESDNQPDSPPIPTREPSHNPHAICVKSLISKPIPLMHKVEYTPYEPFNHYPILLAKLPPSLNNHQLFVDNNNIQLMDECIFQQEQLRRNVVECLQRQIKITAEHSELYTLRDFYVSKSPIYEKIMNYSSQKYFATYLLNLGTMRRGLCKSEAMGKTTFMIRNVKTSHLNDRSKTQRNTLFCRSQVQFNSNFQSGNLFKVFQREVYEYDLILQNDINTKGNNQWFFFSVRNVPRMTTLKFNIVNMSKKSSLFELGMKPAVFSLMKFEKRNVGWVRDGSKISYKQSQQLRKQSNGQPYNVLSFEYNFNYDGDIVYFSHSIPYTFSNLNNYLTKTLFTTEHANKMRVRSIGHTLGGNEINMFQITNKDSDLQKKSIWIMSRQHPGETTASFMMEGIMDFLLSNSEQSEFLLNKFVFKIVPMMNVDGVVHGNTRAELLGCDSNRKWEQPSKIYEPIIYAIKKLIEKDTVQMILDLHSHSKKLGTFFYTNYSKEFNNQIKIFPMMVCKNDQRFDFRSNRYRGGSSQTARKVLFDILNIPLIYTVQSSFYGYKRQGDFKIINYQPSDYRQMGAVILNTFAQMIKKKTSKSMNLKLLLCKQEQLEQQQNLWDIMNQVDEIQSVGSDDNPSQDQFSKKQLEFLLPLQPKNKKNKQKKKVKKVKKEKVTVENEVKVEIVQLKTKRNDKDSYYKKYFSGRCSLNAQRSQNNWICLPKPRLVETRNMGVQVDMCQKNVLNRSNNVNVMAKVQRFEKKSLCVLGQRVQEQFVINGNCIGVQAVESKVFLKSRNELLMSNQSLSKRMKSTRLGTGKLYNQNNFLNKGDILHMALRIFNKH